MSWKIITCCKNMLLYYIILYITETRFDENTFTYVTVFVTLIFLTKDVFLHQEMSSIQFVQVDINVIIIFLQSKPLNMTIR